MSIEEGQLPVGNSGEYLDTTVVTQDSGVETHREAVVITDPEDNDARLKVKTSTVTSDYGITTRDPQIDDVITELRLITDELRKVHFQINLLTEFEK